MEPAKNCIFWLLLAHSVGLSVVQRQAHARSLKLRHRSRGYSGLPQVPFDQCKTCIMLCISASCMATFGWHKYRSYRPCANLASTAATVQDNLQHVPDGSDANNGSHQPVDACRRYQYNITGPEVAVSDHTKRAQNEPKMTHNHRCIIPVRRKLHVIKKHYNWRTQPCATTCHYLFLVVLIAS